MIYKNTPLRYWRIMKHWTLSVLTANPEHGMEVEHYMGMTHFIRYE